MTTVVQPGGGGSNTGSPANLPAGSDPNFTAFTPSDSWEVALLAGLGVPVTKVNVTILDAWAASEATINHNNPLAISTKYPGATTCLAQCSGSNPVMAYDSLGSGVAATVQFFKDNQNKYGYNDILAQFRNNTYQNEGTNVSSGVLGAAWNAINQSGWCHGCQGGKYPVDLAQLENTGKLTFNGKNLTVSNLGLSGGPVNQTTPDQQGNVTPGLNISVTGFLGTLLHNWKRYVFGLLGLMMIVGGIFLILSETKAGQTAAMAAMEVPL